MLTQCLRAACRTCAWVSHLRIGACNGACRGAVLGASRSGGLELLFDKVKEHKLTVPAGITMAAFLPLIRDTLVRERPELFMVADSV